MILDRIKLSNILDNMKMAVGNKVHAVSYYIRFQIDKEHGAIYLSSTDFQTFMVCSYGDCDLISFDAIPEVFLIKFEQLYSLVKTSTTVDIDITGTPSKIKVKTNGEFSLPTFNDVSQFPSANFDFDKAGTWSSSELSSIWSKVSTVVSKDVTKVSYQGVNYDGNWAASDNRRLAVVRGGSDHPYDGSPMLLPVSFGNLIERCSGNVDIGKNVAGDMLVVSNEENDMLAAMRLIDSSFVDYQPLMNARKNHIKITLPKSEMLGVLRRASCLTDKIFKVIVLTICREETDGEPSVFVRCEIEHEFGSGSEDIEVTDYDFDGVEQSQVGEIGCFKYNVESLVEGVAAVTSKDEVNINIQADGKLWIDEDDFSYLLTRITQ